MTEAKDMTEVKWVPREDLDRVILEILHDEPLISAEELAGAIEWPESTVRDALTRLEARGAVLGVDMGATMRRRRRFFLQTGGLPIRSMQDGPVRFAGPQAALDGLVKQAGRLPMLEAFHHLAPRLCQASFVAPDALGISIHWQNEPDAVGYMAHPECHAGRAPVDVPGTDPCRCLLRCAGWPHTGRRFDVCGCQRSMTSLPEVIKGVTRGTPS